jgi:hypothetical protein
MGIGEISCVPEFTGSCGEKFVSCCWSTNKNWRHEEIKSMLNLGNSC